MDDPFGGLSRGGRPRLLTSGHRLHGGIPVNRSCCALYLGRCALRRATVAPWHGGLEWEWIVIVSSRFSGMRSVQVKCRMKHPYPNASVDQICNEWFERRLGEPLCRPGSGLFAGVAPRASMIAAARARLRLQAVDCGADGGGRHAVTLEVVADEQVARSSRGEQRRPAGGEPLVVDEPGPLGGRDRLAAHGGCRAAVGEPPLQRRRRVISGTERPQRDVARLEPPQLPPQRPRRGAVEPGADREAPRVDGLQREDAPGPTVELDGNAARPAGTEGGDDGSRSSEPAPCSRAGTPASTPRPEPRPRPVPRPRSG